MRGADFDEDGIDDIMAAIASRGEVLILIGGGEQCDDGNLVDGDGCDHACLDE